MQPSPNEVKEVLLGPIGFRLLFCLVLVLESRQLLYYSLRTTLTLF